MTRKTKGGVVLGEDQRISPEMALAAYTTMAAKCSHSEKDRGSISVDKLAERGIHFSLVKMFWAVALALALQ